MKELPCEIINEDNKVRSQQEVLTEFVEVISLQLESDDFKICVLDTFANWKFSLKNLHNQVEDSSKETSREVSTLRKVIMILQHTGEPDAIVVQESLRKLEQLLIPCENSKSYFTCFE